MTYDDDFPPPPNMPDQARSSDVAAAIANATEAYISSPEFADTKRGHVIDAAFAKLGALAGHDAEAVAWACYDWLQIHAAGAPYVPLIEQGARQDARFWAETASPPELECCALAAMDRLGGIGGGHALFASRQIKRLAGALFRRMSPDEQAKFWQWINEQIDSDTK